MHSNRIIDAIKLNINDSDPDRYLHNLNKDSDLHPGFISVQLPKSNFTDYIKEVDGNIVVISDCDGWLLESDDEDDIWTYVVYDSINKYLDHVNNVKVDPIAFDTGYKSFEGCFKSAVFDVLQHCWVR